MKNTAISKRVLGAAALGLVLSASAVYAQDSTHNNAAQPKRSSTDLSSTSGSVATGKMSSADKIAASDKKLMQDLAHANQAEIAIAGLAKGKSNDDQVKNYAQMLIDDHTDAGKKLQDLAQKKNVSLPDRPDSRQQAEKKKLESLSGDKFDREFLQTAGVRDHRQTHDLLVRIQKQAKDKDFIHFASNLIPVIDGHLDKALKLSGSNAAVNAGGAAGKTAGGTGNSGTGK